MSVQSEITRIESAKTAIATVIEGKGVTVPEGTKLDGMAALVESIKAGGDCPSGFKLCAGSITLAEDSASIDISSLLGFSPSTDNKWTITFFAVKDAPSYARYDVLFCNVTYYGDTNTQNVTQNLRYRSTAGIKDKMYSYVGEPKYSGGSITISEASGYKFKSGLPLYYVYFGKE